MDHLSKKGKSGLSIAEGLAAKLFAQADGMKTEAEKILAQAKVLEDAANIFVHIQTYGRD